jgi:histidinol dehydrogenase
MIKKVVFGAKNEKEVLAHIDALNSFNLAVDKNVVAIIKDVEKKGDAALRKYERIYDKARIKTFRVPEKDIKKAYKKIDKSVLPAIRCAAANIRAYHAMQRKNIKDFTYRNDGYKITQKYLPVGSAGIYIPGGHSPLFSTVLMAGIPALEAGVKRICITTPPTWHGDVSPYVLVAADMIGIKEIYRVGGTMAIAALALGTHSVPKVDKIAGPGNIYSTMAKKHLFGRVGIDALNGPSEITVIADDSADTEFVFYDLLAQAEHVNGHSLLITTSDKLALKIANMLKSKEKRMVINVTIIKVKNLADAVRLANYKGPEHLLVVVKNPDAVISKITTSPAIFSGNYTPVAFGDYIAGSNHILPTNGTSRFFSGLSVLDFLKHTHIVECTKKGIEMFGPHVEKMAEKEKLMNHRLNVTIRREK